MPDITDPLVVKFLDEAVRPLAERLRTFDLLVSDALATYSAQIQPIIQGNVAADLIEDGRGPEGVSRVTKGDLTAFGSLLGNLQTVLDAANQRDVMRKPCVRMLPQP